MASFAAIAQRRILMEKTMKRAIQNSKSRRYKADFDVPTYEGLATLKLRGLDLGNIPSYIFSLIELEVLDLSPDKEWCTQYRLEECPDAIKNLTNLRILKMDTNELSELPTAITELVMLERLALSNNCLSRLPDGFENLINLQSLHLANNNFETFPLEICGLDQLVFLDMSANSLTEIPTEISRLENLETLMLFSNVIEELPDGLSELSQLKCLWLGDNKLRSLPRSFCKLVSVDIDVMTFDGNPLVNPPLAVCKKGMESICWYFGLKSSTSMLQ